MTPHDVTELVRRIIDLDRPAGTHVADRLRQAERFSHWLAEHHPGHAADDQTILAYLLEHPGWGHGAAKGAVGAINYVHGRQFGVAASGPRVAAHLAHIARTEGTTRLPKTEPLRVEVAQRIAQALAQDGAGPDDAQAAGTNAQRAILELARQIAHPDDRLIDLYRNLTRRGTLQIITSTAPSAATLVVTTGQSHVEKPLTEQQKTSWEQHLDYAHQGPGVMARRLKAALKRTGLPTDVAAGDLDEVTWGWLWANLDPDTPRRVRNLAYLLVGLANARRHAELARLDINDVTPVPGGYAIAYQNTKNGDDHHAVVAHLSDGPDRCPPWCPACALEDALYLERGCHHRTAGPLFATSYGSQYRHMTRQNGGLVIQALTRRVDGQAWGSTRSMRSGAATSAAERDWTTPQIARLTGHRDLNQVGTYVQRHGSPYGTLQLDLDD